jgi:hypothetical protein
MPLRVPVWLEWYEDLSRKIFLDLLDLFLSFGIMGENRKWKRVRTAQIE